MLQTKLPCFSCCLQRLALHRVAEHDFRGPPRKVGQGKEENFETRQLNIRLDTNRQAGRGFQGMLTLLVVFFFFFSFQIPVSHSHGHQPHSTQATETCIVSNHAHLLVPSVQSPEEKRESAHHISDFCLRSTSLASQATSPSPVASMTRDTR